MAWPVVIYSEESVREAFGIARPAVPLADRVALLDALSATGLKRISVGAFVSPRYVPQMADFEALLGAFTPAPGVHYLTFTHNRKAREQAARFSPPLSLDENWCTLFDDLCDVHQRRNMNRSLAQSIAAWPEIIAQARADGLTGARAAIASAWGSNFLGRIDQDARLGMLGRQIDALSDAGLEVMEIGLHDSQSWCLPHLIEEDLREIRRRWPQVRRFHLHLHDARGMALPSLYAALSTLDDRYTLLVDGTLGGLGGGQYCGNGMASAMVATEDFLHMLEGMGIDTGVDLDRVIDCVWRLEALLGHSGFGHVSRAGPRPERPAQRFDPNLPAIESLQAARHFRSGAAASADEAYSPWKRPIEGPWLSAADAARAGR